MAHSTIQAPTSMFELLDTTNLYLQVIRAHGSKLDPATEVSCTLSLGSNKQQTRAVRLDEALGWSETFVLTKHSFKGCSTDSLLLEVWYNKRWSSNVLLGQAHLSLEQVQWPQQGCLLRTLALQSAEKAAATDKTAGKLQTVGSITVAFGLQCSQGVFEVADAKVLSRPHMIPLPPPRHFTSLSAQPSRPSVIHTQAGTLYEEPCVLYLRVTVHRAEGLNMLIPEALASANSPRGRASASTRTIARTEVTSTKAAVEGVRSKSFSEHFTQQFKAQQNELLEKTAKFFGMKRTTFSSDAVVLKPSASSEDGSETEPSKDTRPMSPCSDHEGIAESEVEASEDGSGSGTDGWLDASLPNNDSPPPSNRFAPPLSETAEDLATLDTASSVDHHQVMLALESNGFHVSDVPGGTFFYCKLVFDGQTHTSHMVTQEGGCARWKEEFLFAAKRPLPNDSLQLTMFASLSNKQRGRQACQLDVPVHTLLSSTDTTSSLASKPVIRSLTAYGDEGRSCQLLVSVDMIDKDDRALSYGLPLTASPPNHFASSLHTSSQAPSISIPTSADHAGTDSPNLKQSTSMSRSEISSHSPHAALASAAAVISSQIKSSTAGSVNSVVSHSTVMSDEVGDTATSDPLSPSTHLQLSTANSNDQAAGLTQQYSEVTATQGQDAQDNHDPTVAEQEVIASSTVVVKPPMTFTATATSHADLAAAAAVVVAKISPRPVSAQPESQRVMHDQDSLASTVVSEAAEAAQGADADRSPMEEQQSDKAADNSSSFSIPAKRAATAALSSIFSFRNPLTSSKPLIPSPLGTKPNSPVPHETAPPLVEKIKVVTQASNGRPAPQTSTTGSTVSSQFGQFGSVLAKSNSASPRLSKEEGPKSVVLSEAVVSVPGRQSVGFLSLYLHGFELKERTADCMCVFNCGPFWGVTNPVFNSTSPMWGWEVHLPVDDPSTLLTIALFRHQDNAKSKKLAGITKQWMDTKLIGKLRIRLSTLLPNRTVQLRLPMLADRTQSYSGRVAAHALLGLRLSCTSASQHLLRYIQPMVHKPCLLLMLQMDEVGEEALQEAAFKVASRFMEDSSPSVAPKVLRKVLDMGRMDFTLSRAKDNWRRVAVALQTLAPLNRWFDRICMWKNPLESGSVALGVVLFNMLPSRVLPLLLLLLVVYLVFVRWRAISDRYGIPRAMTDMNMTGDTEEPNATAVPPDPYTALKQQYDTIVAFMMKVQNFLDSLAIVLERLSALLNWEDPVATGMFLLLVLVLAGAMSVLGVQGVTCIGMLWLVRPPQLRDPYPPPPANFFCHLPSKSDTII